MTTIRCPRCGGSLVIEWKDRPNGGGAREITDSSCSCEVPIDSPTLPSPDPWDMVENPGLYDTEAARRRQRTRRG